jgi:poly-gamma-glutamate synthesis protein (capsule biosynthesis protein)
METKLLFCGDTMLGDQVLNTDPFRNARARIQRADLSLCNLETALLESGRAATKRHVVSAPIENLDFFVNAGFHIANLGNNHVLDQGEPACSRLIELLRSKDIEVLGLQESGRAKPVLITRKGVKFGFLGYADYGFRARFMPLRPRIAIADVKRLREQVDCVVVSMHWGFEYVDVPSPAQQRLARKLIDAGANIIVGHHPHVVQGIEEYQGGIIAYSLGNFQFRIKLGDALLSSGTGIMLAINRSPTGRLDYTAIPIRISDAAEVELPSKSGSELSLAHLARLSAAVNGKRISQLRWFREASRLWFPMNIECELFMVKRFGSKHWLHMLRWLLRPANLLLLLFYLVGEKHPSGRSLFQKRYS